MNDKDHKALFEEVYGANSALPAMKGISQRERISIDAARKATSQADARDAFRLEVAAAQLKYEEKEEELRDRPFNEWRTLYREATEGRQLEKRVLLVMKKFEQLSTRLRARREKDQRRYDALVLTLMWDAVYHLVTGEANEIRLSLVIEDMNSTSIYSRKVEGAGLYTQRTLPVALEALHTMEILSVTKPENRHVDATKEWAAIKPAWKMTAKGEVYRAQTTFKAGDQLKTWIQELCVTMHMVSSNYEAAEVMVLKDDGKVLIEYKDEDFPGIDIKRSEVREINAAVKVANIKFFPYSDYSGKKPVQRIDVRERAMRRVYTYGSLESGGRLNGVCGQPFWYPMSKEFRKAALLINDQRVVPIDFSEMAVRMAYSLAGVSIPEELLRSGGPYAIPGFQRSRPAVKKMLNAMFFASNLDKWTSYTDDVQKDLLSGSYTLYHREEVVPVQEMIERIMQEHLPIFDSFNRTPCIGHRLQNLESDIIVASMLTLIRKHQVVSLPTHDCLWVAVGDVGIAQKVMLDTFKQTIGAEGKVVINDGLPLPSIESETL